MQIVVQMPGNEDAEDVKNKFAKLMLSTAAGFIATALVGSTFDKIVNGRKDKPIITTTS